MYEEKRRSNYLRKKSQGNGNDVNENSNSQKHRGSQSKGTLDNTRQESSLGGTAILPDDAIFRQELMIERARRSMNTENTNGNDLVDGQGQMSVERVTRVKDVQKEDLERIRLNKAVINNMKDSICALSKLTDDIGKNVTDVKNQHKAASSLWKDLRNRFKEMSHNLNHSGLLRAEKSMIPRKQKTHEVNVDQIQECQESSMQKLILPKIETGSRPNSTPSLLQMQVAEESEDFDKVSKAKMKSIKKIARKKSQEMAMKDVDLYAVHSIASIKSSTTSFSNLKGPTRKGKKDKCKSMEKRLKEMEALQNSQTSVRQKEKKSGTKSRHNMKDKCP